MATRRSCIGNLSARRLDNARRNFSTFEDESLPLLGVLAFLMIVTTSIHAQQSAEAEKFRDISPDGKFAMRILYDGETNKQLIEGENIDPNKIFSETIKAIELVTLPAKNKVLELLPSDDVGTNYDNITLVWSPDSNWCAFYYNQCRQQGDKFVEVTKPEDLRVDVKGDVRNEYIQPLRWTKAGVLLLEQLSIFRGGEIDDAKFQLTAGLDPKTGKFKVISKKKLPPDVK
ncbi:MAG: hypothetical protein AUH91_00445 [Verrucomicrobia bacterium 13_1_40CM_4_54_4]|nr:MAG: hypothetical protein AUH91_00445 [Verrucomicrobia bacterium 13_1_40CM_4_54_4]